MKQLFALLALVLLTGSAQAQYYNYPPIVAAPALQVTPVQPRPHYTYQAPAFTPLASPPPAVVPVRPYIRQDGTPVNGYYRTYPNQYQSDNFSNW
jgi:hypothetical protein